MSRKSVITWKNVEVTVAQYDNDMVMLLFVNNVCVGRSIVEVER